ncbi:hypothetical protein [Janibacter sp. G368]|uniref:hypothetical protein n=1 Tax=Janibacter sp. G368 TaxID=3420441 RepID=UPI003D02DE2D
MTWTNAWNLPNDPARQGQPVKVSTRTLRTELEQTLINGGTRADLEELLPEELNLDWHGEGGPSEAGTKRDLIRGYISQFDLRRLVALARRVVTELEADTTRLSRMLDAYDRGGGVGSPAKNLIFAANGPKPDLVLRDAVNNDVEITRNAQYCLVYDRPVLADGLRYKHLIDWWREREGAGADIDDRTVGLNLHARLRASLGGNVAEQRVFDRYATRYQASFDIPALIPQVYLHYDPYTHKARSRAGEGQPLPRQRMDFLLLFSDRHRVVIEVDGKQHYAHGQTASPTLYADMVKEDRRLRLSGYEIYRFGGHELTQPDADTMLDDFFEQLTCKMR